MRAGCISTSTLNARSVTKTVSVFFKCPVSLEITVMFNANIFAGTGKLLNRKRLTGEEVFAIVCVACHCNVTLSKNRLAEAQMYMYYTDQALCAKPPSTQHKKQKIQKTPPHHLKSEKNPKPLQIWIQIFISASHQGH